MIAFFSRFAGLCALVLLGATTGCQQSGTSVASAGDRSSYTAARHRQTGSNIPQPDSVDTANSKYDPNLSGLNTLHLGSSGGGGGGR